MATNDDNPLGNYLKSRRAKLDPAAFGLSATRRRTPGLRREEVAQRAHVSATWYTWLEQGRGGAPSADVLDRLARALNLTEVEREHLFLLAQGRPPEVRYRAAEPVAPRLQRVLDSLEYTPAFVKTATWDIVAWNRAAAAVFTDYGELEPRQRNILRLLFRDSYLRSKQADWLHVARFVVAAFRADAARAGAIKQVQALVDELCEHSAEFKSLWLEQDVRAHGAGTKLLRHATVGPLSLEYSAFAVDGRPDLGLVIYCPATPADARRIRSLVTRQSRTSKRPASTPRHKTR
ncbi:hypothetical protein GALL_346340 [mine drainage metagenome]|uniref:HTH cro/C1-type domain-containing protein n=1 Tax=mine drainage metagenome TaxID=410659 RepID=A0A1J5QJ86_9ZZZZ